MSVVDTVAIMNIRIHNFKTQLKQTVRKLIAIYAKTVKHNL